MSPRFRVLVACTGLLIATRVVAQSTPAPTPPAPVAASAPGTADAPVPATLPKGIHMPAPRYDGRELRDGHEGRVHLHVTVGVDGKVRESVVAKSSGWPVLDAEAVATARTWTFSPALDAAGAPMESKVLVPIDFSGGGRSSAFGASTEPEAIAAAVAAAEAMSCAAFVAAVDARGLTGKERGSAGQSQYQALVARYFIAAMAGPPDAGMGFVKRLKTLFPDTVARCRAAPDGTLGEALKASFHPTQGG